jgi:hypothetical protein
MVPHMISAAFDRPPWWRVAAAFVAAPAIAALAYSSLNPMYEGLPDLSERIWKTFVIVSVVGGYFPSVVLGVPIFLFLRRRVRPTLFNCTLVGATVAALPWLVLALLPIAKEASTDGRTTVVDYHLTWFGLSEVLKLVGEVAVFGLLAGIVFWLFVTLRARPAENARCPKTE